MHTCKTQTQTYKNKKQKVPQKQNKYNARYNVIFL
jgi:hypothetical protein